MKRLFSFVLVAGISACFFSYGWAVVMSGDEMIFFQPNGLQFVGKWYGDEFFCRTETEDGYTFVKNYTDNYYYYAILGSDGDYAPSTYKVGIDDPILMGGPKHLMPSPEKMAEYDQEREEFEESLTPIDMNTTPDIVKLGIILIQFFDHPTNPDARGRRCWYHRFENPDNHYFYEDYWDMFFSTGTYTYPKKTHDEGDEYVYGSVRDYWLEVTYETKFIVPGGNPINPPEERGILNRLDMDGNPIFYTAANPKSHYAEYPHEIFPEALAAAENEGFNLDEYDYIGIIGAGPREGRLVGRANFGGKHWYYPERDYGQFTGVGGPCHEMGHNFGIWHPPVGTFGLMSSGWRGFTNRGLPGQFKGHSPVHPSAWTKIEWGLVDPINFLFDTPNVDLLHAEENPVCWRLWKRGETSSEYFLVENRQPIGFDREIGEGFGGFVIYHIGQLPSWLEAADNNFSWPNDETDLWPGPTNNTKFGLETTPSSNRVDGFPSWVVVDEIQDVGNQTMRADIYVLPTETHVALTGFSVDAIGFGGNDDSGAQLGETFDLVVHLKNFGLPTGEATVTLSTTDPCVSIMSSPSFTTGHLDEDETYDNGNDPFIINALSSCLPGDIAEFQLEIVTDDRIRQDNFSFILEMLVQSGYPVTCGPMSAGLKASSPTLADLNGDCLTEVVLTANDGVWAFHGTEGNFLWKSPSSFSSVGYPTIGDIDNDGELEIVVHHLSGGVYALDSDGSLAWNYFIYNFFPSISPALGDVNRDGVLDVVFATQYEVYALDASGGTPELLPFWPQSTEYPTKNFYESSSPTLADIDQDGELEIIIGTYNDNTGEGRIYVWNSDGSTIPLDDDANKKGMDSSPAIGDLDDDGSLEIVTIARNAGSQEEPDAIRIYSYQGGWVSDYIYYGKFNAASPALGDLDQDGQLEIIIGSNSNQVYAINRDGELLPDYWPVNTSAPVQSRPVIGDMNGDGEVDVIALDRAGNMYAWNGDGLPLFNPSNPIFATTKQNPPPVYNFLSPIIGDVDGDGDIEVLARDNDRLYAWDCEGIFYRDKIEWGEFHKNARKTGLYAQPVSGLLTGNTTWLEDYIITGDVTVGDASILKINPGVRVKVKANSDDQSSGSDPLRCELIVSGHLSAIGTACEPITFKSHSLTPVPGDWHGIRLIPRLSPNLADTLIECEIEYAYGGIFAEDWNNLGPTTIENNIIRNTSVYGIKSTTSPSISGNTIQNSGIYGIFCSNSLLSITNNTIENSGIYGIRAELSDGIISDNVIAGILPHDSENYGIYLLGVTPSTTIENNAISKFDQGGILCNASSPKIRGNSINNNLYYGLVCVIESSPVVTTTEVNDHTIGVWAEGGSYPNMGDLSNPDTEDNGQNCIHEDTDYHVYNGNESTVPIFIKAENNWWGEVTPDPLMFYGLVDYDPWLPFPSPCGTPTGGPQSAGSSLRIPRVYGISQNYPNPFNPQTLIRYQLPKESVVTLKVYNIAGQRVRTLIDEVKKAGYYRVVWDGQGNNNRRLASGVYFLRIEALRDGKVEFKEVKKAVFLR
jgi:M6 family metalloprotease-like protein